MHSSFSIPPIPAESMIIDESPSQKPATLLLRTNRPYLYNSWILNNRLRLKNEKLSKRQQSSCRIAFYSLCICVSAGVTFIVIYRFTDECSLPENSYQFPLKCLRHWLFLAVICTSLLACSGLIFGVCRYFRSQRLNFLYDEHVPSLRNTHSLSPMTRTSHCYCSPTLLANGSSIAPSAQTPYHDEKHSNTTVVSSRANTSPRRKMPPFNYDELPNQATPIIISMSPDINNHSRTRCFSSSTSTLSSPYLICPSARTSNTTTATINSNRSKATSMFEDICPRTPSSYTTCLYEANIWERQQRLPSLP